MQGMAQTVVTETAVCLLGFELPVVRFPAGVENFPLRHRVQTGSAAHQASYPMGTLFLGVKRPGREADPSPPSSAEVKE
jgi:hypothetical protein